MKNSNWILLLIFCAFLTSCAHKSGHGKEKNKRTENPIEQKALSKPVRVTERRTVGDKELNGSDIFRMYNTAVFTVFTSDGVQRFQGSGFFISNDGLAVSNYHVFKGTNVGNEVIKLPGQDVTYHVTQIYAKSEDNDFILFRVDCKQSNYIPIARDQPSVGEKVYAIGSPRGLENTFSSGEISQWRDKEVMQINVQIDHGSSGGALINSHGEVVGITSGTFYEESNANLNYAWSIDVIKSYIR